MGRQAYIVRAERDGGWWGIDVPEVEGAFSQARRIDQVEEMAREVVSLLLDIGPDTFDIKLDVVAVPAEWADWIEGVNEAKTVAAAAEQAASSRIREVARALKAAGLPVRDVGALLGVSAQRVSQLTNSPNPTTGRFVTQVVRTQGQVNLATPSSGRS